MDKYGFNITHTSCVDENDGTYHPSPRHTMHDRINFRGERSAYHILDFVQYPKPTLTSEQRKDRYEVCCLEKGIRPFGYPDKLWEEYLSDVASEEHTAKCEEKEAWRYIN